MPPIVTPEPERKPSHRETATLRRAARRKAKRPTRYRVCGPGPSTAYRRALVVASVWLLIESGERIDNAVSPFALRLALRRLERSGAIVRRADTPSGYVAGPRPAAAFHVVTMYVTSGQPWAPAAEKGGAS